MSDEYFLAPTQVHVVSQGDDLLWDGASKFVNSDTLRFRVGDSVKCLVADIWVGGARRTFPSPQWHAQLPRPPLPRTTAFLSTRGSEASPSPTPFL